MAPLAMKHVSRIVAVVLALMVVAGPAAAADSGGLLGQLECPCDCGKYLSVCDCGSADEARSYVQNLRQQGLGTAEIADSYGQEYGDQYDQYVPKEGSGLSLWLTPLAGVILGAGGIFIYFRRFRDDGQAASVSICPDCGTQLDTGAEYCPSCGSSIEDSW